MPNFRNVHVVGICLQYTLSVISTFEDILSVYVDAEWLLLSLQVAAGDVLCEIETDKATLDLEAMEDGYVTSQ